MTPSAEETNIEIQALSLAAETLASEPSAKIQWNQRLPMRDGICLSTDIYRPSRRAVGTILLRTIYSSKSLPLMYFARKMAMYRFAVVIQNARGRNGSEGIFRPFEDDNNDGFDTLQWLVQQPWCNGKIGLLGLCYSVFTNYRLMTAAQPPGVTIVAAVSAAEVTDFYNLVYPSGVLRLHWALPWLVMMRNSNLSNPKDLRSTPRPPVLWTDAISTLPLSGVEQLLKCALPDWHIWLTHSGYDHFWKEFSIEESLSRLSHPILHIGGWFDPCLEQTIACYDILRNRIPNQSLIVGPWNHESIFQFTNSGPRDTTPPQSFPLFERVMNWYGKWFGGPSASEQTESCVEYYVTGEEQWKAAECWPSHSTTWVKLYFTPERSLELGHPHFESSLCFTYDPLTPRPTLGGNVFPFGGLTPGPLDQREIENRPDTLILSTERFAVPTMITGMLRAVLYVASSAQDTDFTVAVSDVHADGRSELLGDSIIRMRFLLSASKSRLVKAGAVYKAGINVGYMAHLLQAGHRLRVAVSSSNFPKFSRNLNVAGSPERAIGAQIAEQVLYFGGLRASYLHVPLASPSAAEDLFVRNNETAELVSA